jgi:YjbE family integral membrane protein
MRDALRCAMGASRQIIFLAWHAVPHCTKGEPRVELLADSTFWSALGSIIVINLVLSGDNAVVIALAARSLPKRHQNLAIVWGTVGAVAVRVVLTLTVVWVLEVPGLMFVGAVLLAWIAYRLLTGESGGARNVATAASLAAAIRTIIVADAVMGLDNVLGVAGAARGSIVLVVIGLSTSIPIVVWGSRLILKWMERYPWLLYIGGVLAWTAGTMLGEEPLLAGLFARHASLPTLIEVALVVGIPLAGWLRNRRPALQSDWR